MDLDAWIEKVRKCEFLAEDELKALCEYVRRYGYLWLLALSLCAVMLPAHLEARFWCEACTLMLVLTVFCLSFH